MSTVPPFTYTLTDGTTAFATQVMADLNLVRDYLNIAFDNFGNYLALSGGTISGNLTITGNLDAGVITQAGIQVLTVNTGASLSGAAFTGTVSISPLVNLWAFTISGNVAGTVPADAGVGRIGFNASSGGAEVSYLNSYSLATVAHSFFWRNGAGALVRLLDLSVAGVLSSPVTGGTFVDTTTVPDQTLSGLKVQATSDTQITIAANLIPLVNSSAAVLRAVSPAITISTGASGANGLDTGALANNTWYNVYAIGKADGTLAGLISLSATAPTLPSGYTFKRRVGAVRVDGSAHLWRTLQYANRAQIVIGTNPTTPPQLFTGVQGSAATPTWITVALASFVPPTATTLFAATGNNSGANFQSAIAPNGNYGAASSLNIPPIFCGNPNQTNSGSFVLESTNVFVYSQSACFGLVHGWTDNL